MRIKKNIRTGLVIFIWIILWQIAAWVIGRPIFFVGPMEVCESLVMQIPTLDFWRTIVQSSVRICGGFLLAFAVGAVMGITASRIRLLQEFLEPAMSLMQSVPVASFVILALIWIGSENLSVLISFVVVVPVIYRNTLQGMASADEKLLELAQVFRISGVKKFLYIYRPALFPYLYSASRIAFGMAWKSGVAAEVIGVPDFSIGEKLYMSKIYLSTAELFAWTLVIIAVSRVFEWIFLKVLMLGNMIPNVRFAKERTCFQVKDMDDKKATDRDIFIQNISKSYDKKRVLQNFSLELKDGEIYCLMGPSGVGKTTLLRILMGLEQADSGDVRWRESREEDDCLELAVGVVFQENRLLDFADAVKNIRFTEGKQGLLFRAEEILETLLEKGDWNRPVRELSGGMQRRVAIGRALAAQSNLLLMDEPFTGLDEGTKERVIETVLKYRSGRTLLVVTHQEEEAELLGAEVIQVKGL